MRRTSLIETLRFRSTVAQKKKFFDFCKEKNISAAEFLRFCVANADKVGFGPDVSSNQPRKVGNESTPRRAS